MVKSYPYKVITGFLLSYFHGRLPTMTDDHGTLNYWSESNSSKKKRYSLIETLSIYFSAQLFLHFLDRRVSAEPNQSNLLNWSLNFIFEIKNNG